MFFCDGEYLKLTFNRVVFVAWYKRLVLLYFLLSPSVLEVGIDSWFLTYMSSRIDFSWILESLNLNDVLMMLRYVFRTSQVSYVLLFLGGLDFYGCLLYRRFVTFNFCSSLRWSSDIEAHMCNVKFYALISWGV